MIDSTAIIHTIDELEALYNAHPSHAKYFSKLALLEVCGWIEISMDQIVIECSACKLSIEKNKDHIKDEVVDRIYGFHYKQHFRSMLMKLLGMIELEKIESKYASSGEINILASQLGTLHEIRNKAAHTNLLGATHVYEAPSALRGRLTTIFPILQMLEADLAAL